MNSIQKTIKILAICFAVFIITSIVSAILMTLSLITGFDKSSKQTINFSETYQYIDNIDIELGASKLIIKKGTEFKVEADNVTSNFKSIAKSGTLKINESRKWPLSNKRVSNITLCIPENYKLNELLIENGAGAIDINDILAKDFNFNQGAGTLKINNSSFEETYINGGVGEIKITNSVLNNLKLDTGVGSVDINSNITGDSEINSGIGKVSLVLGNQTDYQIHIDKGLGSININDISQPDGTIYGTGHNRIKIDSGIGEVNIKFTR